MNDELLKKMLLTEIDKVEKEWAYIMLSKDNKNELSIHTDGSLAAIIYTIVAFENSIIKRHKGSKEVFEFFRGLIDFKDEVKENE